MAQPQNYDNTNRIAALLLKRDTRRTLIVSVLYNTLAVPTASLSLAPLSDVFMNLQKSALGGGTNTYIIRESERTNEGKWKSTRGGC